MFSKQLQAEVDEQLEWYKESPNFTTTDVAIYDILNHILFDEEAQGPKTFTNEIRHYMIAQGVFREITQEELNKSSIKKADFRLGGKMYRFERHNPEWEAWFNSAIVSKHPDLTFVLSMHNN